MPDDPGDEPPEAVIHNQRLQLAVLAERVELMAEQCREFRRVAAQASGIRAKIDELARADRRARLFGISRGDRRSLDAVLDSGRLRDRAGDAVRRWRGATGAACRRGPSATVASSLVPGTMCACAPQPTGAGVGR